MQFAKSPAGALHGGESRKQTLASHPAIAIRLKRAEGHLHRVIGVSEECRTRLGLFAQLQAVGCEMTPATKRALIHDHCHPVVTDALHPRLPRLVV